MKKIALGADHAGFKLKEELKDYIKSILGYICEDFGTFSEEEKVDYPDYAKKVAAEVASGRFDFGLLICATGIGMSIAANKVPNIRAALCYNTTSAKLARLHNDSNILVLGSKIINSALAKEICRIFFSSDSPKEERHKRRIKKIENV